MAKLCKLIGLFLLVFALNGCWDKVEINERAFISAIGIDKYEYEDDQQDNNDIPRKKLEVSYLFPNLDAIGKGGKGEPSFIITGTGSNMFEISKKLTTKSNKTIFLAHTKAIIFGEDLVKDPETFKEVLDGLERDPNIGRKINVLIAKGKAKEIIEVKPEVEPVVGTYISELVGARERSGRFNPQNLGELLPDLHSDMNSLMPIAISEEDAIKISGAAVIKNYKLIGYLDEMENRSILFLKNEIKSDDITIYFKDAVIPYVITSSHCKKSAGQKEGQITVEFNIETEGYIEQYKLETGDNILDNKMLLAIEEEIQKEIKRQINEVIRKLQSEFKIDVIGVGDYLSKYKPDIWEAVEDIWEQEFQNVEIKVNVDSKVRRIGMVK